MIRASANDTVKSLRDFQKELKRKLEETVRDFATEMSVQASLNTPVGDADAIENKPSYRSWYVTRYNKHGIEIAPGFHSGAWVFSKDNNFEFDNSIYETEEVKSNTYLSSSGYALGDTFYIGASGPGFGLLENAYSTKAPDGIMKPTLENIIDVYSVQIKKLYERA